jgi:hypothetical protein
MPNIQGEAYSLKIYIVVTSVKKSTKVENVLDNG